MPSVLFICAANRCRSPMASALLLERLEQAGTAGDWHVESAGLWAGQGEPALENAQTALGEMGLDLGDHRSCGINREKVRSFDLILTMERGQKEALSEAFPEIAARVYLLSEMAGHAYNVADPAGGSLTDFVGTAHEIDSLLSRGFDRIVEQATEQKQTEHGEPWKKLFHLCLGSRWDPAALEAARTLATDTRIDWDALIEFARTHRLAPLLYDTLRGRQLLPPPMEQSLRQDYFANAGRNMRLFHELEKALGLFPAAGIPVILLKGAALGPAVYGNDAARPLGDIDLLVRQQDVPTTLRLLTEQGYQINPPLTYRSEVMLRKGESFPIIIEVHWNLLVPPYYQYILPRDWPWQGTLPLHIGGAPARTLSPEAQIIYLCAHLSLHHRGQGPLWLHDIAEVIACYQDQINWQHLLARTQDYGLVAPVKEILTQIADPWQAPIPPDALTQLQGLQPAPAELRVLANATTPHQSAARRFRDDLVCLPGWRARLHFAWQNLFPPPAFVQHCYGIHPLLLPLFYPFRWFLGLRSIR